MHVKEMKFQKTYSLITTCSASESKMSILKRSTKKEATWLIYTLHLNKNISWIHLRLIESSWATQLLNMKITNFIHLMSFLQCYPLLPVVISSVYFSRIFLQEVYFELLVDWEEIKQSLDFVFRMLTTRQFTLRYFKNNGELVQREVNQIPLCKHNGSFA